MRLYGSVDTGELTVKMLSPEDPIIERLPELIRFVYVSEFFYDLEYRETPAGFSWSLIKRPASPPIRKESRWKPFDSQAERPRAYVAWSEGAPLGYIEFAYQEWNKLVRIWHLYVAQNERRHGIGSALMQTAVQAAEHFHARGIVLETQTSNAPAISFYMDMGFEPWGLDVAAYTNEDVERGEVLLSMGKKLL